MPLSFLNRFGLAGLLALAAAMPAAAEWREIPYADIAKMPLSMKKVDPQRVFTATLRARPGDGQTSIPADFRLQVKVGGEVVSVTVRPDGRVELPVRQDWADAGAMVQSNQPKGRIKVDVSLEPRTPPGTRMSYAKLAESAPVMERGIKEMAGKMSFLAPKVRQLVLRFDKTNPQTVTLTLPGGKKMLWKSDAQGRAELPWEPKWLAATIELSAPLQGIEQVLK